MRKLGLLSSTIMTHPIHLRHMNRLTMASAPPGVGDTGGGSGEPAGGGNNTGGNGGGDSGTGNQGENNSGQKFDLDGFWSEPKPTAAAAGESGTGDTGTPAGEEQQGADVGKALAQRLNGLKFDALFDQAMIEEMNEGNLANVNERVAAVGRESVRQSLMMSAELMQTFGGRLLSRVEAMIEGKLGGRDDNEILMSEFPAAKDPAVKPMIQNVFNQAMKHTSGDRPKAVALAKDMLKLVGNRASADFGFETPPGSREDTMGEGPRALVESLLARE